MPIEDDLLVKLDEVEEELSNSLTCLNDALPQHNPRSCDCELCKAIAPFYDILETQINSCSCRLCRDMRSSNGHAEGCTCKLHRVIRSQSYVLTLLRGALDDIISLKEGTS